LAIITTSADKTEENSVWTGSTHTEKAGSAFGSFWTEGGWGIWKGNFRCREECGLESEERIEGIERAGERSSFFLGVLWDFQ